MVGLAELEVRASYDRDEIYDFLARDRLLAAYLIGDLEPPLWDYARFSVAYRAGEPVALALVFNPGHFTSLLTVGDAGGIQAILGELREMPDTAWYGAEKRHLRALRRFYHLDTCEKMRRLVVTADTFEPVEGEAVRLTEDDLPEVEQIYRLSEPSAFLRAMFLRGIYFGVHRGGRLVSIAGSHFISERYSLAAVGNVVTAEEERGRGYATWCTGAVTAELLKTCRDVVLNVRDDNRPARRVYSKLGYGLHCAYWEGRGWSRFGELLAITRQGMGR